MTCEVNAIFDKLRESGWKVDVHFRGDAVAIVATPVNHGPAQAVEVPAAATDAVLAAVRALAGACGVNYDDLNGRASSLTR